MKLLSLTILTLFFIPKHDLTWKDYTGKPEGTAIAHTTSEINLETTQIGDKYYFRVWAEFIPEKSFTRTTSQYILQHERTHFAITRLYAAKLSDLARKATGTDEKGYNNLIACKDQIIAQWNQTQELFDKETNHSIDSIAEKRWENNIFGQLK